MKILFTIAMILFISSCATTSGTQPIVGFSGFDNAKTVSIQAHGNACSSLVCTGLGAKWNSSNPERAILTVKIFNEYTAISEAKINIDGKKISLLSSTSVTDFSEPGSVMKTSKRGFGVPLSVIEEILSAKRAWLRVYTPTGYIEDAIIEGDKDSKAFHALSRFMKAINSPGL